VVVALGADVQVGFEFGLEENGAAAGALDPKALGSYAPGLTIVGDWGKVGFAKILIGVAVRLAIVVGLETLSGPLEPGHTDPL
jgi:hypothetical protein